MTRLVALAVLLLAPAAAVAQDAEPPQIVHEPCAEYARGDAFDIWARFYDQSQIFDPKIIYRVGKSGQWRSLSFKRVGDGQDFKATIAKRQLRGVLEYFIEVFDEHGNGPARFGAPEAPVEVKPVKSGAACRQLPAAPAATVDAVAAPPAGGPTEEVIAAPVDTATPAPSTDMALINVQPPPAAPGACDSEDPPLYCAPWFWGGVAGLLVAGGGVTVYLLTRPPEEVEPSSGKVFLDVTGAGPTAP